MKMNVFEFTISAKHEDIAGFENLGMAIDFAKDFAEKHHCDVDVINAFTGEVHKSFVSYKIVTYNADNEQIEFKYRVAERVW